MKTEVCVKFASNEDVDAIVKIHEDAFKDFFLTSLGTSFLKFYYSCFINSNDGHILCAINGDSVLGFAALAENNKGFNSRLVKHNLISFGIITLKMIVTSPRSLWRLIKNLNKSAVGNISLEDYAELFSLGVLKSYQGQGVGKILLDAAETLLKSKRITKLSLTTDYYDNESTIGFYRAMHYYILYDFIAYPKRRMYRLIKEL